MDGVDDVAEMQMSGRGGRESRHEGAGQHVARSQRRQIGDERIPRAPHARYCPVDDSMPASTACFSASEPVNRFCGS